MIAPGDIVYYSFRNFNCMFECAEVTFPTGSSVIVKAVPGSVVMTRRENFEAAKGILAFEYEHCKKADSWQCIIYERAIGV